MVFLSISLVIGLGKISLNFLGLLSSNTTSEYHLELKAVDCIKTEMVSFPF
jgi:hypothetical protein